MYVAKGLTQRSSSVRLDVFYVIQLCILTFLDESQHVYRYAEMGHFLLVHFFVFQRNEGSRVNADGQGQTIMNERRDV